MKRFSLILILIIICLVLLLVVFFLINRNSWSGSPPYLGEKSDVSAHTIIKDILPIGEYASLVYHYTSVVKDINSRDINGWTIPFTTRKYIFTYDGKIKLGIDGTKVRVEEAAPGPEGNALPVIRIILPPIVILSHEIMDDSIEVFEQSQTIFNEIKIQDAFKVTAERKREMEERVMAGDAVKEARISLEQQFGAFLKALPDILDNYVPVFVWQSTAAGSPAL
ncbi:MAG: DUF4230 domain-containing protein [Spirochaetaceae bacterium]|jgi:hypothetical protein|nr:DUF4230 domain-containing protein [Spirochaetaceae bacterium]